MAAEEDPLLPPPHPLLLNPELRSSPCSRNYGRDSLNGGTGWKSASWNLPESHHLGCQRKLFMGRWVIRGTLLQSCMWGKVSGGSCWPLRAAGCLAQQKLENGEAVSASLTDGSFQGEAAGHWVLVVALHCRSQALENLWCFQTDAGARESCLRCSNLRSGPTRSRKQSHFPLCNVFPVPSTGKPSVPAGKGETWKRTRAIFTEQAERRDLKPRDKHQRVAQSTFWLPSFHMPPSTCIWILPQQKKNSTRSI